MPRLRKKSARMGIIAQPPELDASVTVHHTYRYSTAAGASESITVGNLLSTCGSMATLVAGTTKVSLASSILLHKIQIWSPAAAAGAASPTVAWNGAGGHSRDEEKIVTTVGTANASYYVSVPPKGSFAELWQDQTGAANVLFTLSAGVGSIIDVSVSFTLANNDAGFTVVNAVADTSGVLYYPPLDGATNKFVSVGLANNQN